MPKQEPSIKKPSKPKATAAARPAASKTIAAPKAKVASTGGARRNGSDLGERIRQRAYEIWEREGRPEGREQEHWEQAEREVAKSRSSSRQAAG